MCGEIQLALASSVNSEEYISDGYSYMIQSFTIYNAFKVGSVPAGVVVNAVDILPSALPLDATNHFGARLMPLLQQLLEAQKSGTSWPEPLANAAITHDGKLMPKFEYIAMYVPFTTQACSFMSQLLERYKIRVQCTQEMCKERECSFI